MSADTLAEFKAKQRHEYSVFRARQKQEYTVLKAQQKADLNNLKEKQRVHLKQLTDSQRDERTQFDARQAKELRHWKEEEWIRTHPPPIRFTGGTCEAIYKTGPIAHLPWGCRLTYFTDRPAWGRYQFRHPGLTTAGKPYPWNTYTIDVHNGTTYVFELQNKRQARNEFEMARGFKGQYEFRGQAWDPQTKKKTYSSVGLSFNFE